MRCARCRRVRGRPRAPRRDLLVQLREAIGRVAVVLEPGVPGVDMRQRAAQHARPVAADHQPRPRAGEGRSAIVGPARSARERDALARQQAADDREGLLEARDAVVVREPNARNSGSFQPAPRPSTKRPPLTSSIVAAIFAIRPGGWKPRMPRAGRADPLGGGGQRPQQRPRLPGPALGPALIAVEEMVADPDRVEAALLGRPGHRPVLGPAHVAFGLGELDSDSR